MSEDNNKEVKRTIVDDVEIIEDGNTTYFRPVVKDEKPIETVKEKSWFQKVVDYFKDEDTLKPYIRVRNLNNPNRDIEEDHLQDSSRDVRALNAIEVGIKFKF